MAIYHFSAKVISRANGSSAVAAAAYRSACELHDVRLGRDHDFSGKDDVIYSEIMLPEGAPERWLDREALWNEVETGERRCDAQLAREVEFAIPREMSPAEGVRLASEFVRREFVNRGMVADLNVHWDRGEDGSPKPHAHVMLSMREVTRDGVQVGADGEGSFGKKVREWNSRAELEGWRERWAEHVNERLVELGIEASIDHRSLADQGIALEPQGKIGPAGARREARGEDAERAAEHRAIARRNGERLIAEPQVALEALTRQQSTFGEQELQALVFRHSDSPEQYQQALSAVRTSPELVTLGRDGRGRERFSTREMIGVERRLERSAEVMAGRGGHEVSAAAVGGGLVAAEGRGLHLGEEQRDALERITGRGDVSLVVGFAGTGKSAMLGVAREAWELEGYQVRGAALSGIAAEGLEAGSAIPSRTIASLEHAWGQGREVLTDRDVLVIDEAGMVGSRQMDRVLEHAERAGAKVVLVGDPEQLQAIEAGAAFRALRDRHGAVEITEVRRQREEWQRDATRELATGRTRDALERYAEAGMVVEHRDRGAAREAVVEGWAAARTAAPDASQLILAHTNADVAELNRLARGRMREAGELGEEVTLQVERGERAFAAGDRVMFLRNERSLEVKNGTLGVVQEIDGQALGVKLDDGRGVSFDLRDYGHVDHGYASTIHKAQGVTVDRAHVLATPGLDRHGAYVALTRHRDGVAVHYGVDEFAGRDALSKTLSRERAKDTTLDYQGQDRHGQNYDRVFAERRGIHVPIELQQSLKAERPRQRGMFDGLDLKAPSAPKQDMFAGLSLKGPEQTAALEPEPVPEPDTALRRAVRAYALAIADIEVMRDRGQPPLPDHEAERQRAGQVLAKVDRGAASDLAHALARNPGLARSAETRGVEEPNGMEAIDRAMAHEARVRRTPELRAERFVEQWRGLEARRDQLPSYDRAGRSKIEDGMAGMARDLQRDPQVDSLLRNRKRELGLSQGGKGDPGMSIADELNRNLGRYLGLGR